MMFHIIARMNALTMPAVIRALYRASQAGVEIDLIVRGACCLRPGVTGVSETIRFSSIVGRFLEHSRVYYFHAGGKQLVFASSADWMSRNLERRVETCFPIDNEDLKQRVLRETLLDYLKDNQQAWRLATDGSYRRIDCGDEEAFSVQVALLERLTGDELPQAESDWTRRRGKRTGKRGRKGKRRRASGSDPKDT